ncbi:MAG: DUF1302 domain-containing protein [Desulfuromonadales bacterium]|nr:DUF1302 domain-containing protein [Desulfuromonadales bacterium]
MNIQKRKQYKVFGVRTAAVLSAALVVSVLFAVSSFAFQFEYGDLQGSLDSTLSYGSTWRVNDQDPDLIGTAAGGNARSVNFDDGNLNYGEGMISKVFKLTSDLEMNFRNVGLFVRGTAFYDFINETGNRNKMPLTDEALDLVGSDADLLDSYVYADFDLGDMPLQIRVGDQVVSWGESTFIQNSINAINPVNVSAIRLPGAELKEALTPEGMVWTSIGPTENTTLEAFYLYDWEETVIDPPGSYWSTNDFAGEGGERVMLGWGAVPDNVPSSTGAVVGRSATREADDDGQYGLAFRLYAPWLNDTEFGFYYMNYHSRLPVINARTGTAAAAAGIDPNGLTYAETASYFISYPEDIKLYGVSFNTELINSGVALQGEVSHRQDMPLQIDDIEILFAALGAQDNLSPGNTGAASLASGQLGLVPFESDVQGYIERDVTQVQTTATKLFGPTFGASQWVLLGEVGVTYVHDMPDKDELRLNGPGTPISGNETVTSEYLAATGNELHYGELEPASAFADDTSWGYRLVTKLDYDNAIGAITLSPRIAWQHDVDGTSPGPGGNFVEGRKAVTLGVGASYLNNWSADLSYTDFFGAGRYNLINDRDIIALNVKYYF